MFTVLEAVFFFIGGGLLGLVAGQFVRIHVGLKWRGGFKEAE